jgi:hypothetical protein
MTSYSEPPREEAYEDVLEDAREADHDDPSYATPLEADPADSAEQRQPLGGDDEDDYR